MGVLFDGKIPPSLMLGVINVPIGGFKGVGQGGHGAPSLPSTSSSRGHPTPLEYKKPFSMLRTPLGELTALPQTHCLVGSRLDSPPRHKYRKRAIGRLSLRLRPSTDSI